VRQGKHGARSPMQAIAIGLSKARRAGIDLPPPKKSRSSQKVRRQAERDLRKGHSGRRKTSARRSRASSSALRRESRSSVSRARLSRQAKSSASKARPRSAASRLDRRGSHEGTHGPAKGGCESGQSPPAPRLGSG
jgi:hypothetical protein